MQKDKLRTSDLPDASSLGETTALPFFLPDPLLLLPPPPPVLVVVLVITVLLPELLFRLSMPQLPRGMFSVLLSSLIRNAIFPL